MTGPMPGPDPIPTDLHDPLMQLSIALLREHRRHVITFWVADGQSGFRSTYGVLAEQTPGGKHLVRLRHLGEGGLVPETTLN